MDQLTVSKRCPVGICKQTGKCKEKYGTGFCSLLSTFNLWDGK